MGDLNEVIRTSKVILHEGRYAYLKANENEIKDHFLITKDKDETTIITEEENLDKVKFEKDVKWFKLVEIKVSAPFVAKGFLAKITKTIADKNLNVLVVSTFSKDYILVREETWEIAIKALEDVGFPIVK
ncbi:MAG: ACT domain-containing protein [Nanoarchaeota archaeon]|nr:ACT domain-containing protein [Nanoarchaeota archaeon]MBU1622321.1 ACT domain-containing protein [Nanoarchaeota archaeon]